MKIVYLAIIMTMILFNSCDDNPVTPTQIDKIFNINGPTIIYRLIGENSMTNRVYNSNSDKKLFAGSSIRSNVRISPNKKSVAYAKNAFLHPWYGFETDGTPTVVVSTDGGITEKELFRSDSARVFYIDWIGNDKIAISSYESNLPYLTIVNTSGEVLVRKNVPRVYTMHMLPDGKHLVAYNNKEFALLDVTSYNLQTYTPDCELLWWQTPFFTDSALVFNCYVNGAYRLLEFNMNNNTYNILSIKTPNVRMVYADANNWVYYNYVEKKLNLFKNGSQISTITLIGFVCNVGLSLVNGNEFYFVGKSTTVDDEGLLVKVDFNSNTTTKLTNHGEDKFVVDTKFYNL